MDPILIWPFEEAPKEYRKFAHGDRRPIWVFFIPEEYGGYAPDFLCQPSSFESDSCSVSEHDQSDGSVVAIRYSP